MEKIKINFKNLYKEESVFYAGGYIEGDVTLCLNSEKVCKRLILEVKGCSRVRVDNNIYNKELFLDNFMELPTPHVLHAGSHVFPFQYKLPFRLPQSREIKDSWGIDLAMYQYYCNAIFEAPNEFSTKGRANFTLKRCETSNYYPILCRPITKETQKSSLTMRVELPYAGLSLGETVLMSISFDNESRKSLDKTKVKLIEAITVYKTVMEASFRVRHDGGVLVKEAIETPVNANESGSFKYELTIPESAQISDVIYGKIIQVMHVITVDALDCKLFIPVVIGSKRGEESAQPHEIYSADNENLEKYLERESFYNKFMSCKTS